MAFICQISLSYLLQSMTHFLSFFILHELDILKSLHQSLYSDLDLGFVYCFFMVKYGSLFLARILGEGLPWQSIG